MEEIDNELGEDSIIRALSITDKLVFAIFSICILTILIIFGWSAFLLIADLEAGGGPLGSIARSLHIERIV